MAAIKVELSPRHVAFRTMQNWVEVAVIARIESHRSGRVWGYWFSKHTPEVEVPVGRVVALVSDKDADEFIRLIRGGRELPAEFVQRLHVIAD